jgi:hypothetical protein
LYFKILGKALRTKHFALIIKSAFFMKKIHIRLGLLTLIILAAALCRLLPHPMNVTPVTAMALFGGAYFAQRWQSILVPLASLWVSDLILNNVVYKAYHPTFTFFHESSLVVYGSIALTSIVGWFLLKRIKIANIVTASLLSSTLFFLITNFNYWQISSLYPKTTEGLMMSYTAALPFFGNALLGDLMWCAILFGGYELAKRQYPILQSA